MRRYSIQNNFDYESIYNNFKWNVPKKFNFAQDVIDRYASDHEKSNLTAFYYMSEAKKTRKWTFKELSDDSKKMASGLFTLGPINRAMIILPRIPEWWILNLAAMRINTVLLPGTTQLTANDITRLILFMYFSMYIYKMGVEYVVKEYYFYNFF